MAVKYGWTDEQRDNNYQYTLLAHNVGAVLGAVASGYILKIGRRRALILGLSVHILGNSIQQVMNFPMYLIGNFILALAAGLNTVAAHRYIEEVVPTERFGSCLALFTTFNFLSDFLGGLCASILPPDDDKEALMENKSYRILLGSSSIFAMLVIILLCTVIRHDTVKWYLANGKREQAKKVLQKYYVDVDADAVMDDFARSSTVSTMKVTYKQALFTNPTFRKASWVSIYVAAMGSANGNLILTLYGHIIYQDMNDLKPDS